MSRPAIVADVPEISIRPVGAAEFAALADLTVAAYRAVPGGSTSAGYEETLRDVATRAREAEVLVAVGEDGTLLGGITFVPGPGPYAEFSGPDEAGIRMLAVSPAAQRLGIGRRLVLECIGRAQAAGTCARRAVSDASSANREISWEVMAPPSCSASTIVTARR